jgi:hypothetical protein
LGQLNVAKKFWSRKKLNAKKSRKKILVAKKISAEKKISGGEKNFGGPIFFWARRGQYLCPIRTSTALSGQTTPARAGSLPDQ